MKFQILRPCIVAASETASNNPLRQPLRRLSPYETPGAGERISIMRSQAIPRKLINLERRVQFGQTASAKKETRYPGL